MRGFQGRNNSFGASKHPRSFDGVFVADSSVFGAPLFREPRMFGADRRVIKASGNGMCSGDLAILRLQYIRVSALQDARTSADKSFGCGEPRCVFAEGFPPAA